MNNQLHEEIKQALKEDYDNSSTIEKFFDGIVSLVVISIMVTVFIFAITFLTSVLV